MKINFVAPVSRSPSGGVRVITETCRQLSQHFDSGCWPSVSQEIQSGSGGILRAASFKEKAHWIVSECQTPYLKNTEVISRSYSIFVQNPYIVFLLKRFESRRVMEVFRNAAYIFCISEDAEQVMKRLFPFARIKRIKWTLDPLVYEAAQTVPSRIDLKKDIITYMPRKCREIHRLLDVLPTVGRIELRPLVGLRFEQLISELLSSRIFIALSEYEGFAAPPVEAYSLGNMVVGFAGNGNRRLFRHENFYEVAQGDFNGIVEQLESLIESQARFDLANFEGLISKFDTDSVTEFNLRAFEDLSHAGQCRLDSNFYYPRNALSQFLDKATTKFFELT